MHEALARAPVGPRPRGASARARWPRTKPVRARPRQQWWCSVRSPSPLPAGCALANPVGAVGGEAMAPGSSGGRSGAQQLGQPRSTAASPPGAIGRGEKGGGGSGGVSWPGCKAGQNWVAGFPRLSVRRGLSLARTRPSYSTRHVQLHRLSTRRFPTFREETRCASVPTAADSLRGRPLAVVARAHQHSGWSACQRRC